MFVVDIIITILLGFSLYKGLQRGLVVSLVSFVALLVGIYLSLRFSFFVRNLLSDNVSWSPNTITIAAFFITFLLVLLGMYALGKVITKLIDTLALGFLNKIAGALFEGIKMVLILSVFINLFQKINYNHLIVSEKKLDESVFYNPIEEVSKKIFPLMDKWYRLALTETVDSLKEIKEKEKSTLPE